jgi:UDP-N-acetylmuramoyl-L-alanyl-D-glutamate--2,6-diaminopimelate ligase
MMGVVLSNIINSIETIKVLGSLEKTVNVLTLDSREKVDKGLFFAVKGSSRDGHEFIGQAVSNGCEVVICEDMPTQELNDITVILVANVGKIIAEVASLFYDEPSKKMTMVGVTGTNGKTTVATLLYQCLSSLGQKVGLLSTVENRIAEKVIPSTHTTPDAISLQKLLAEMADEGCTYVFMEVSSHALVQCRTAGIEFKGGIFTNITQDHLDYHKTFDQYIKAKKLFFDGLSNDSFALVNKDDRNHGIMVQNTKADVKTYALKTVADYKARLVENNRTGLAMSLDGKDFYGRMIGEFNAYNLLVVYATLVELGFAKDEILTALSTLRGPRGRFEYYFDSEKNITAIVDYAHTPDALENVLETIKSWRNRGKIVTVVGCGGNRDKDKRPKMAKIGSNYSDVLVLTSDNPRDEDPEVILQEMEKGIASTGGKKTFKISDRKEAIKVAFAMCSAEDILLVAGKGHETYQEIKGVKYPFDDAQVIQDLIGSGHPNDIYEVGSFN